MKVTRDEAINIGNAMGLDWKKYNLEEFRRGLEVEQEHIGTVKRYAKHGTDVMMVVGFTVKDHLDEKPNYYTLLDKVGL